MTATDPVNYSEIARRVGLTRQRVKRIMETNPDAPGRLGSIGRQPIYEWTEVEAFFEARDTSRGPKGWKHGVHKPGEARPG